MRLILTYAAGCITGMLIIAILMVLIHPVPQEPPKPIADTTRWFEHGSPDSETIKLAPRAIEIPFYSDSAYVEPGHTEHMTR